MFARQKLSRRETLSTFVKQSIDYLTMGEQPRSQGEQRASRQTVDYKASRRRLKKAIFEFYRGVEMLQKYRLLNRTGFAKILKKFDKVRWYSNDVLYI